MGVPVVAGCDPLGVDLFLFCYGRDLILMRETSCCLFLTVIGFVSWKYLTIPQDILVACLVLLFWENGWLDVFQGGSVE